MSTSIVHLCAVPVDDWDAQLNLVPRPCGSEAIPGVDQQMCAAHYGRWRRATEARLHAENAKRMCMFCQKPMHNDARAHGICAEAAKDDQSRARCVQCEQDRVGPNGRYCPACVASACEARLQGDTDDVDLRILGYLAARLRDHDDSAHGLEFDDTSLEDNCRQVRPGAQYRAADALVNRFEWRHPDGFIQLGDSDMVLWPIWSPRTRHWVVFKCQRDSGYGKKFHWIPLEYQDAADGEVLSDLDVDWCQVLLGTGEADLITYEHRPAEFHHFMDEAWNLAVAWRNQLAVLRQLEPYAIWDEQVSFGGEVWAMREMQNRNRGLQQAFRQRVRYTKEGRFHSVESILDTIAMERARKRIAYDASWTRDAQ